uniref:Putative secreted protein n=1 Tax=Amblyomma cajennense TaxID=34607 RepID=A0A023FDW0_AMBCJ
MLFEAFVVVFLGLSGIEAGPQRLEGKKNPNKRQDNNTIQQNVIKLLQNDSIIGLALISYNISDVPCKCLRSRLVQTIEGGAVRSWECYINGTSEYPSELLKRKTNVTTTVSLSTTHKYPLFNASNAEGELLKRWDENYDVIFATKSCFVLKFTGDNVSHPDHPTCIGLSIYKKPRHCVEFFVDNCQRATLVNYTQCDQFDEEMRQRNKKTGC